MQKRSSETATENINNYILFHSVKKITNYLLSNGYAKRTGKIGLHEEKGVLFATNGKKDGEETIDRKTWERWDRGNSEPREHTIRLFGSHILNEFPIINKLSDYETGRLDLDKVTASNFNDSHRRILISAAKNLNVEQT
jgi:hypothetical protein